MAGDEARIQAEAAQLASPVMGAAAGLHGDQAAGAQLHAPSGELVGGQGLGGHHASRGIDGVDLDHSLGQIDANSGNYFYMDSPTTTKA